MLHILWCNPRFLGLLVLNLHFRGVSSIAFGQVVTAALLIMPTRLSISSKVRVLSARAWLEWGFIEVELVTFKKYGIGVKFTKSDDAADFDAAIDEKTKAIFVESIGNPKYNVPPIPELAEVSKVLSSDH